MGAYVLGVMSAVPRSAVIMLQYRCSFAAMLTAILCSRQVCPNPCEHCDNTIY